MHIVKLLLKPVARARACVQGCRMRAVIQMLETRRILYIIDIIGVRRKIISTAPPPPPPPSHRHPRRREYVIRIIYTYRRIIKLQDEPICHDKMWAYINLWLRAVGPLRCARALLITARPVTDFRLWLSWLGCV